MGPKDAANVAMLAQFQRTLELEGWKRGEMELAISPATISLPNPNQLPNFSRNYRSVHLYISRLKIPQIQKPKKSRVFAKGDDGGGRGRRETTAAGLNLRWSDVLYPDPENMVAVGLTGLLTWASVQVLWQLLFISVAIILAAIKYSFIAAILLFILITLV